MRCFCYSTNVLQWIDSVAGLKTVCTVNQTKTLRDMAVQGNTRNIYNIPAVTLPHSATLRLRFGFLSHDHHGADIL